MATIADDLLRGGAAIAEEVFGDPKERRAVYRLAGAVPEEDRLPVFRMGAVLCARKSTLAEWFQAREAKGAVRQTSAERYRPGAKHGKRNRSP
jgi:hypothetical protein